MTGRNVFFVCGAPKSGTTWMQRIFDAHPAVVCSGEGHFVERLTNPFSQVVKTYNQHMVKVADQVYEGKPYYPLMSQDEFDDICRAFIVSRLAARAEGPAVRWIGDKTPRYTLFLPSLLRLFPKALFFHIARDPRDVAVSRLHHAGRAGFKDALAQGSDQYRELVTNAATAWRANIAAVAEFKREAAAVLHEVTYEALLESPRREMERLFAFLDVDRSAAAIERIMAKTAFETLSGGRKRGEEDLNSFYRKGIAGDWQGKLDDWAQAEIKKYCGALMDSYGYE